jgi:hypothetical protein
MPQHFAFEGTDWGHHTEYEELADSQEYFDQEGLDQLMCEGSSTEPNPYPLLDDMLIDPQGEPSDEVVHSEMHLLQDGVDDNMDHKNSMEDINDSYSVENYEDNLESHEVAEEILKPLEVMHEIFLSDERFISPGSTEISRAKFVIRHQNDNHKFINTVKEVKLDSCGSVSLAHSKYLSSIQSCKQYNIPIVSLNGIGERTNPLTSAGILSHVKPGGKIIKFLCYVFDSRWEILQKYYY